jgi:hypothetical protein
MLSAVLMGQVVLLAGCTDGGPPPASPSAESSRSVEGSPTSGGPSERSPTPPPTPPEVSPDPSVTQALDSDQQGLLDRARAEGALSVIVEVGLDGTASPNSSERRQLVAEAQDDLIAELDPAHVSVQTRFRNTAQLTLTVDEDGLLALFGSPRVTHVWANESIPLD